MRADLGTSRGNRERGVGERRAANLANCLVAHNQAANDAEALADFSEGALLASFGALPVGDMQGSNVGSAFLANRERGTDGGVHASGEGDDGLDGVGHSVLTLILARSRALVMCG